LHLMPATGCHQRGARVAIPNSPADCLGPPASRLSQRSASRAEELCSSVRAAAARRQLGRNRRAVAQPPPPPLGRHNMHPLAPPGRAAPRLKRARRQRHPWRRGGAVRQLGTRSAKRGMQLPGPAAAGAAAGGVAACMQHAELCCGGGRWAKELQRDQVCAAHFARVTGACGIAGCCFVSDWRSMGLPRSTIRRIQQ
jgi:hypothetical protein